MEKPRKVVVVVTNRTIVRVILWIGAAILAYKFFGRISHVLILIFAAFFLAMALNPIVGWISRRLHVHGRARATAIAYLTVVIFLTGFFSLVIPPLVTQTRTFIKDVPQTVQSFQTKDNSLSRAVKRYHLDQRIDQTASDFAKNYGGFGTTILDTSKRIVSALASFLAVLVLAFMMLVEGPSWLGTYFNALPAKRREHQKMLAKRMYRSVTGFVNGQVILAIVAGIFAFLTLEIAGRVMDVPTNAVALGGIVAVFGIIPLFGNPIAALIVILACLLHSAGLALVMLVYFVIYFFIENHTFQPYIQARLNELTALTVFVAALIGVGFGGLMGAIVAIPAASAIRILVTDSYQRHKITPDVPET